MGSSLQDQLVKAGLAKKSASKPASRKRKARKKNNANSSKSTARASSKTAEQGPSLAAAYAARAKDEQQNRELRGKRKQMDDERRRKINLKLKEVVLPAAQNDPEAETERYLQFKGKIRKLFVTEQQQVALNNGQLGIVYLQGRHYLLEPKIVNEVRKIQEENISLDPQAAAKADPPAAAIVTSGDKLKE